MAKKHEDILDQIRVHAAEQGHRLWPVNPLKGWFSRKRIKIRLDGRWQWVGLHPQWLDSRVPKSCPDLVGFLSLNRLPIMSCVEVKTKGTTRSKGQVMAGRMLEMHGVKYCVGYSLEEFQEWLEKQNIGR